MSGRFSTIWLAIAGVLLVARPVAAGGIEPLTSLANPAVRFQVPDTPYVVLRRGPLEAVVVDNRAVDDDVLHDHQAGYSGIAALRHTRCRENLFVERYAGLNFEHIHDGTTQSPDVSYEPRRSPCQLRLVGEQAVEIYQPPTPHWRLESSQRIALMDDGVLELVFECIPHARAFRHGYIGLFWASYINRPESLAIHFQGVEAGKLVPGACVASRLIRGVTREHGVQATHLAVGDGRRFRHDADFPYSLVFSESRYRYTAPWYFGLCRQMAWVQMFRTASATRFTQSPSGGGSGNPAWDFQWFIADYQVGQRYQFRMRSMYIPLASNDLLVAEIERQRLALERTEHVGRN